VDVLPGSIDPQLLNLATMLAQPLVDEVEEPWQQSNQYALVEIAGHSFAIDIGMARQIIERPQITPVPNTPDFILGVCNVRGDIFSIVDIRPLLGFELPPPDVDPDAVIIVLEGAQYACGATIQAVSELLRISESQIVEPTTEIPFVAGIFRRGQDTIFILDVQGLLDSPEMTQFR
jgi:purine-binding chemotaxis protein CheW